MQTCKYRLKFKSPLHISSRGVGFEQVSHMIHSDTLFGAIVDCWFNLYPEDESIIFGNSESPPFLVSSAFPYFGECEFFPKPYSSKVETDEIKALRKVQFIEKSVFFKILSGEVFRFESQHTTGGGNFWIDNSSDSIFPRLWVVEETPRVVIDRYTGSTNHYFVSELYFEEKAGLFFLVKFKDRNLIEKFETALRFLGDQGLGLDRSSGKGLFNIEKTTGFEYPKPEKTNRFLTLSLYHPSRKEIETFLLENASYDMVYRGGWITSNGRGTPYRRQVLTMFAEGSVFSGDPDKLYGDMPTVISSTFKPQDMDHKVYRYGCAFPLGIV